MKSKKEKRFISATIGEAMRNFILIVLFIALPSWASANDPDCTGVDRWPTSMAFVIIFLKHSSELSAKIV